MFKAFFNLVRFLVLILIFTLIFHNLAARKALSWGLQHALGVPVEIESARIDFWESQVMFRNVLIQNPEDFPPGYEIKMPYLTLSLDRGALFDGKINFKKIEADVSDFQILRAPNGRINWLNLKPIQNQNIAQGKGVSIEHFILTIRRGTYRDLSKENSVPQTFVMDLDDRDYLGIHTIDDIVKLISWEALKRMGMEKLGTGVLDQMKADLEFKK